MTDTAIHPHAEFYPLLDEDALQALADDIRENGLLDPITVTADGILIDGRNRLRACELIGIEPETVIFDGDDIGAFVRSKNMRRHQPVGSLAMSTALSMAQDGLRKDGKWAQGSSASFAQVQNSGFQSRVSQAGTVLDWLPELAGQVIAGELPLKVAYAQAVEARNKVDADKQRAAIEASRKREATIKEKQENDRKLAALTEATSRYLTQVEAGNMSIAAAYAAHMEDTRKQREEERELDMGRRDACTHVAEAVRTLSSSGDYADVFLSAFYPHEDRFLAEGMRLTQTRIQGAIDFLTNLKKGVKRK